MRPSELNEDRQRLWENMKSPRLRLAEKQEAGSEYTDTAQFNSLGASCTL